MAARRHPSSFRDPSGFLYEEGGTLLRQVCTPYAPHYDRLMASGLYSALEERGWLVPHREVDRPAPEPETAHRVLEPDRVPFVSYPYEWSFGQYRRAALLTLDIQRLALEHGMTLKDASAYNIQFLGSRPVLIDSLSFAIYEEGGPWVAYRQFCQHFLAPLALMSYRDARLGQLMRTEIDGPALDLACRLLPWKARLRFPLLAHLFLHAKSQKSQARSRTPRTAYRVSPLALRGLIESLRKGVSKLRWNLPETEWGDYYAATNYTADSHEHKAELVGAFLERVEPDSVWDLGANTGRFSRIASGLGASTVAFDVDPAAVEKNYRQAAKDRDELLLPLRLDLSNPSPALGWGHEERQSLLERGPADAVMALALVHHLAIGNNVPLERVARFLSHLGRHLIVEFVPKEDSQVERLLATREDVFPEYHQEGFERAFEAECDCLDRQTIRESRRTLYLFAPRSGRDLLPESVPAPADRARSSSP